MTPFARLTFVHSFLVVLILAACAPQLKPAPEATRLPGSETGAVATEAGVRIEARAGAWRGYPSTLASEVTPILISIDNGSQVRLRVRYNDFALVTPRGQRFAALPPFDIHGVAPVRVSAITGPVPYGFYVAPYHARYFPSWSVFGGPFTPDPFYYDTYWPRWTRRVELPTSDMIVKALPEGVIEPGGRVTGFLHFEEVDDVSRVIFVAQLIDAATTATLGMLTIPFVVD